MKFVGQLLGAEQARHPALQIADVYKLLHQAALGPAHAVDGPTARSRLAAEIVALGSMTVPDVPLAEPISPDGRLARIHLRPYLAAGLSAEALADAFAETARTWQPAPDKLAKFCGCLGDLADVGGLPFPRTAIETYMEARRAEGWPAVHHSDVYRDAYRPAYRVVDLQLLPELPATAG